MRRVNISVVDIQMIVAILSDLLGECDETMPEWLIDDVVYALAYFKQVLRRSGERE